MLLVTFHGGSGHHSINNVYAFETVSGTSDASSGSKPKPVEPKTIKDVLGPPKQGTLSELRAMVFANGLLYVANGAKSESTVLAYTVPASGTSFTYAATLIGPTLSGGQFGTAIAHPFGIAFSDDGTCFVSNQDTNVVAQITVSTGKLVPGPPVYLSGLFPTGNFLPGTYVASQVGLLPDVETVTTVVDHVHGGLAASFDSGKVKNSVRDVAVANGILFVCDEPERVVNLYSLTDGSYLGSSSALAAAPTHFAINNGGLYVSAGTTLYWGMLPQSASSASLSLQSITPASPATGDKIGGISFDGASTVYVPYQSGTGGSNPGGSIYSYSVSAQNPPVLSNGNALVSSLKDTPEFVLYWSGGS
jgi:hypothetical protein